MKLHLPKQLFTALLAAITLATPTAWSLTASYEASFSTAADFTDETNNVTYTKESGAITGSGILADNGTLSRGLKFDLKLNDDTNVTAPANVANIVSITTGTSATWGFLMKQDGTVTGNWNGVAYPTDSTEAQFLVTQDELAALKADDAATSVTLWAKINKSTGTHLYYAASMNNDSKLYSNANLHTASGTVSSMNVNSTYVDRVYYAAVAGTEGATATFTNTAGNWTKSWTVGNFIDAAGLAYQVDGLTELNSEYDIVAGGANGLSIAATEENAVTLGNTMYLATVTSANGSSVSISNGGEVNLNGAIYLVEDATLASTGDATITISGTVTDKGVPTGSAGSSVDGAYTLGLSGSGYHFTGAVDVNGLRLEEGAEATFDNLTIDSTITGTGKLILNNGTLNIANGDMLDDVAYTYANGAASGFRTGYSAILSEGSIETQDGAQINIALEGASDNVAGSLTGNRVSASYTSTVYDVNEALDYGAETMGGASRIQVNEAGTLTFAAGVATTTPITNMGTVTVARGEGEVTLNDMIGATGSAKVSSSAGAEFILTGSGNIKLSGNITISNGGKVTLKSGTFGTADVAITHKITGENSTTLVLDGVTSYISGNRRIAVNLLLKDSTLHLGSGDVLDYDYSNGTTVTTVGQNSRLDVGANRQSLRNASLSLTGGVIYGAGALYSWGNNTFTAGLDFYDAGTIDASSGSSIIATGIASRASNKTLTLKVGANATLTIGSYTVDGVEYRGALVGQGSFNKTESGTLIYKGAEFTNGLTISGGVFEYYMEDTRAHSGRISGAGTFKKSGSGTLTLDSANTSVTMLDVAGGKLVYNSSTETTHTLSSNAGTTFEKTGSSTLTANINNLKGELLISAGTLKLKENATATTSNSQVPWRTVTVGRDAVFDINGKPAYNNLTLESGSTLSNLTANTDPGSGERQLPTITLTGAATMNATGHIRMLGSGHDVTALYLGGHTLTKTGTGTFFMQNTHVKTGGTIQINAGLVKAYTTSNKTQDLNGLNLHLNGGNFELADSNQNIQALTLTSGTLTIGSELTLTTMGDVIMAGSKTEDTSTGTVTYTSTVSGNLCLSGTITLNGSVNMSGATLSGTSLAGFTLQESAKPAASGLQSLTYQIWSGDGSINTIQSTISVGGVNYTMNAATGTFTTAGTEYYVATGDTITVGGSSATTGVEAASAFHVASGAKLDIAELPTGWTAAELLAGKVAGAGTLLVSQSDLVTGEITTTFRGTLELAGGKTLTLGETVASAANEAKVVNTTSLNKVILNEGSRLQYQGNGSGTEFKDLSVNGSGDLGATIYIIDGSNGEANAVKLTGNTELNHTLNLTSQFGARYTISNLSGTGTLNAAGTGGESFFTTIQGLKGFEGSINFTDTNNHTVVVSTGTEAERVSFDSLQFTAGEGNTNTFNVQTNTTVGTLSLSGGTTATISVDAGKTLTVSTAISGLAPGSVTLGEGAVLDLTSQVVGSGATAPFVTLLNLVSGSGTVKFQGFTLPPDNDGDESKWRVSLRGDTSLTLNSNVEVVKGIAFNTYNTGAGYKDILSSKNLTVGEELRLESAAKLVVSGGTVSAGSISLGHHGGSNYGHVQLTDGCIITGSIGNTKSTDTGNTVTMSDGVLEITSASGIASGIQTTITGGTLKASGDVSWGITGASIGGAIIETGTGSINLAGGTLTNKLDNSAGNLALSGEFNVVSSGYTDKVATLNATGNGYASTSTVYTLVSDAAKLSGADTVTWKVDGATASENDTLSYADGALTHVSEGTEYYVVDSDIVYGSLTKTNTKGEALTALVLNGKGVNLNESLGEGVKIKVQKVGESVVAIGEGLTLNANQVESTATQKLKLHGSGTYTLASGASSLGTGVVLGAANNGWTGTVRISSATDSGKIDLNALGNASSTVALAGVHKWVDKNINVNLLLEAHDVAGEPNGFKISGTSGEGATYNFNGNISGDGDLIIANGNDDRGHRTFNFNGGLSDWEGNLIIGVSPAANNARDATVNLKGPNSGSLVFFRSNDADCGLRVDENHHGTLTVNIGNSDNSNTAVMNGTISNLVNGTAQGQLALKVVGSTDFNKDVVVTSAVVNAGKTATITGESNSITAGNVKISQKDASLSNVTVQSGSIAATSTADGATGSISDALVEMQSATSFTIQDMVLSNVKLSAAEGAGVALNNVSGSAELAGAGSYNIGTGAAQYTLGMAPAQVGTIENDNGSTALTLSYSSNTSITMSGTGSRLLLSADPTADVNGVFGTYNLTLTLNYALDGIDVPNTTARWQELVGFTGILGDLLTAQTPEATVDLAEGEAAVAAAGSTPTVEYNYTAPGTGAQVGTLVITISGLNVPEPASATLGLAALMMLCARRRRKA